MNEQEMDEIVERIKAPIQELEGDDAELLMLHACFEVVSCISLFRGLKEHEVKARIIGAYDAFRQGNPYPTNPLRD